MDKVVLITGASRGIGASTALLLAEQGYKVAINYREQRQAALQIKQQITAANGCAEVFQSDVTQEQDVADMFSRIHNSLGRVTHLVNNAGILSQQMPVMEMDARRINHTLQTNVTSCFLCAQQAVRDMRAQGVAGAIVNVSSAASRTGSPNEYVDYAASKGAVDAFTIGLAKELAPEGIRVNSVRPGLIHTDIHADGGEPERVSRLASKVPLGRGGEPEEVAQAIRWLLSDEASFVTGAFVDVTGGL